MIEKISRQGHQIAIQKETIDVLTLEIEKVKDKLLHVPERLPKVYKYDQI